jgi:CubicO group peptidase (beta-lactamase class C family)
MTEGVQANVEGKVEPGFERVRIEFAKNLAERGEIGAAFCVYHRGRKVVDLWGGHADKSPTRPWREDTLTTVFSTTKGVAALVLAVAHSRGWLEWDRRVSEYWPEFAEAGKGDVTVRQLLAHQAGLSGIDEPLDSATLADPDRLAPILARQAPAWTPGTRNGYHAISLGWYQNELLRRVDPQGRTIGQFLREEIAPKLGLELYIGLPDSVDTQRLSAPIAGSPLAAWRLRGRPYAISGRMMLRMFRGKSLTARAFNNPKMKGGAGAIQSPELRRVEIPSANGIADARSLARFYSVFAEGGEELGIGKQTLDDLMAEPILPSEGTDDAVLLISDMGFSLGFSKALHGYAFGSSNAAFGTPGAGGSFAFADPDARVAMAYVMNQMGGYLLDDPREKNLRDATYRALARLGPAH